jgi:hypothetical protein
MFILLAAAALCAGGSCMEHTRCSNTPVGRHGSPDGKYVAVLYHRSCAGGTGRYTVARIEEASSEARPGGDEAGHVLTIREFHPITAKWKDSTHLEVITPGLRQQNPNELAAFPPKASWKDISITYRPAE